MDFYGITQRTNLLLTTSDFRMNHFVRESLCLSLQFYGFSLFLEASTESMMTLIHAIYHANLPSSHLYYRFMDMMAYW